MLNCSIAIVRPACTNLRNAGGKICWQASYFWHPSRAFERPGERSEPYSSYRNGRDLGSESIVYFKAATGNLIARVPGEHLYHPGDQLTVQLNMEKVHLFDAETENIIR
jgi:TOBE domain